MYECPYDVPLVLPDKAHAVESSPGSLFGDRVLRFRLPRFLLLTVRFLLLPEGGGGGLFRPGKRSASEGLLVASDQFPDALYLAFRGNGVLRFRLARFLLLTVRFLLLPAGGGGGLLRPAKRWAFEGLVV